MGMLGKDFKYKIIKNFLTESEVELANKYFTMKHRSNIDKFDEVQMSSSTQDSYWYGDPLAESFLLCKMKKIEEETKLKLVPTYAFARVYSYLAVLDKHKDRPECEISVTVMVGSSGEKWPIFMDGKELNLEPGDAAIYLGCEVEHWREEFLGDWHSQFFLHYTNKDGPYKDRIADGRLFWGIEKPQF
jgi:hypothetical protein